MLDIKSEARPRENASTSKPTKPKHRQAAAPHVDEGPSISGGIQHTVNQISVGQYQYIETTSTKGYIVIGLLGDERLPVVPLAFDVNVYIFILESSGQTVFSASHTPRPNYYVVNRLPGARQVSPAMVRTLLWVRAPTERATFRLHGAVDDFIDRSCVGDVK